jgi:hypothetical protein
MAGYEVPGDTTQNTYEKEHQDRRNWRQRANWNKTGEQPLPAGM